MLNCCTTVAVAQTFGSGYIGTQRDEAKPQFCKPFANQSNLLLYEGNRRRL